MARRPGEERRHEILAAVKSLLAREGTPATSVRRVAGEAGISTGSLRHIFPSHEELFLALLEEGRVRTDRQVETLRSLPSHRDLSLDVAVDLFMDLLPTDAGIRVALIAQLAVHTTHPDRVEMRQAHRAGSAEMDGLCQAVVAATCAPADVACTALELRLVLDGLSLRLLGNADFGETEARAVLRRRLRQLCFL